MTDSDKAGARELPIYKVVDGALIQIAEKNGTRRYAHVTDVRTGDSYLREFTDKEEAEADLARDKWESEAPQRAADEQKQKDELAAFQSTFKYKERIFAFIDILGWSSAVKESGRLNDEGEYGSWASHFPTCFK